MPRQPQSPPPSLSPEYQRFVETLLDVGREQLRGQLEGSKQWDAKALGFLTAIGALAGIVAANHDRLGGGWIVVLFLLAAGVVACTLTLLGRDYDIGPNIREAHDSYGGLGDKATPMLVAEIQGSIAHNGHVARWKGRSFMVAIILAVASLFGTAASWIWLR